MRNIILLILFLVFSLELHSQYKEFEMWVSQQKKPAFFFLPPTAETVMDCLLYYKVKHPEIVLAQGILETEHFKSNVCIENNNLFGLRKDFSKYHKFSHWTESILYYLNVIQVRYKPPNEDYYQFLKRIKYAQDKRYIHKLKQIINARKNFIQSDSKFQSLSQRTQDFTWDFIRRDFKRP